MHLCVLDSGGSVVYDDNLPTRFDALLAAVAPFRDDLIVGVECLFGWYWLSDRCEKEKIPFLVGHALYMKAIHRGKAKNDRIDANKIARLIKGGNFPLAYVYPKGMRETRDLSAAAPSWSASVPVSSPICRYSTASTTCRPSPKRSPARATAPS
jgi:transposase